MDDAVVFDDRAGVDDRVGADFGAGVDDRAGSDEDAFFELGVWRDDRGGVDDRWGGGFVVSVEDAAARGEVADREDPTRGLVVDEVVDGSEVGRWVWWGGAVQEFGVWVVVVDACDGEVELVCGLECDGGVSAGADEDGGWGGHGLFIGDERGGWRKKREDRSGSADRS